MFAGFEGTKKPARKAGAFVHYMFLNSHNFYLLSSLHLFSQAGLRADQSTD